MGIYPLLLYIVTDTDIEKDPLIGCLLAIKEAGFPPDQKVPSKSMLLAFLLASKREALSPHNCSRPELFIEELRIILAQAEPPSTQDIAKATQLAVAELEHTGTLEAIQQATVLNFTLTMLKSLIAQEAQSN